LRIIRMISLAYIFVCIVAATHASKLPISRESLGHRGGLVDDKDVIRKARNVHLFTPYHKHKARVKRGDYTVDMCHSPGESCGNDNEGVCRPVACHYGEIECASGVCPGYDCRCCKPEKVPPTPPAPTTTVPPPVPITTPVTTIIAPPPVPITTPVTTTTAPPPVPITTPVTTTTSPPPVHITTPVTATTAPPP
ncbi:unnamed protein product, partial [Meganyctiphanes norvegica]